MSLKTRLRQLEYDAGIGAPCPTCHFKMGREWTRLTVLVREDEPDPDPCPECGEDFEIVRLVIRVVDRGPDGTLIVRDRAGNVVTEDDDE